MGMEMEEQVSARVADMHIGTEENIPDGDRSDENDPIQPGEDGNTSFAVETDEGGIGSGNRRDDASTTGNNEQAETKTDGGHDGKDFQVEGETGDNQVEASGNTSEMEGQADVEADGRSVEAEGSSVDMESPKDSKQPTEPVKSSRPKKTVRIKTNAKSHRIRGAWNRVGKTGSPTSPPKEKPIHPNVSEIFRPDRDINSSIPYYEQGDPEMETAESLQKRRHLKTHPAIVDAIRRVQRLYPKTPTSDIHKHDYKRFGIVICQSLISGMPEEEADAVIEEDWATDVGEGDLMTEDQLFDSLFELTDLWTSTLDEGEYLGFIDAIMQRLQTHIAMTEG